MMKIYRWICISIFIAVLTGVVTPLLFAQTPEVIIQNGHNSTITALAMHPEKNQLVSLGADGQLAVWDMETRMMLTKFPVNNYSGGLFRQQLKFSRTGENVIVDMHQRTGYKMSSKNSGTTTMSISDGTLINHTTGEIDFGFNSDAALLLTANEYTEFREGQFEGEPLFARSWIFKQDPDSTRRVAPVSFDQKITRFISLPNENIGFIGFFDGTVKAIDGITLQTLWEVTDFDKPINSLDVSEISHHVIYTSGDLSGNAADIMIRDLRDGSLVKKISAAAYGLDDETERGFGKAVFSPDGKYIAATGPFDHMVWEADTFDLLYSGSPSLYFTSPDMGTDALDNFGRIGRITDLVFHNDTNELILASGSSLFSFDIVAESYSALFNQSLTEDYEFNDFGLPEDDVFYINDGNDGILEKVDLLNFESEIYDYAFWSKLIDKAVRIDTTLNNLSVPPYGHPGQNRGNIMRYQAESRSVFVWAHRGDGPLHANNYFLEFDSDNWSFKKAYGPFEWSEDAFNSYSKLMHLDVENGWYAMKSNTFSLSDAGPFSWDITVRNLQNNEILHTANILDDPGIAASPSGRYVAWVDSSLALTVHEAASLREVFQTKLNQDGNYVAPVFASGDELYFTRSDGSMEVQIKKIAPGFSTVNPVRELENELTALAVSDNHVAVGLNFDYSLDKWKDSVEVKMEQWGRDYFTDPNVLVMDRSDVGSEPIVKIAGVKNFIDDIVLNDQVLLIKPYQQPLQIHSLAMPDYRIRQLKFNDFNIFTDGNYYKAPKEALSAIGLKIGEHVYPVENFDILFNRPDLLMDDLGLAPAERVSIFRGAYEKRLARNGIDSVRIRRMFDPQNFPSVAIANSAAMPAVTSDSVLTVDLQMVDKTSGLAKWTPTVNGVPVYGSEGKLLNTNPGESAQITAEIPLAEGLNQVKIIAENKAGVQSAPIRRVVNRETYTDSKPDVYIVSIGVSDYRQDEYDLQYAAKDAGDVQQLFERFTWGATNHYGTIHSKMLTDDQVTRDSVRAVKEMLRKSDPDDIVLVFLAGHGVLVEDGTYYFAGHDMNFEDPASAGISYDDIQYLFDGIPARKRVLFMDTCQSGEVDESELASRTDTSAVHTYGDTRIVTNMQRGVGTLNSGSELEREDAFSLMKELFIDFNSTGTVIISAASGTGYALENDTWQNGVFTYSIIRGLGEYKADTDGNRRITVSELRDYILNEVEILTEGRQTPTARQENPVYDFRVW